MKTTMRTLESITANDAAAVLAINNNFKDIEKAIDNSLSRDGTVPNYMETNFDINGHRIINVADPVEDGDVISKKYFDDNVGNASEAVQAAEEFTELSKQYATATSATLAAVVATAADINANIDTAIEAADKAVLADASISEYLVEVKSIATEVEENSNKAQVAAGLAEADADATAADRVAVENAAGLVQGYEQSARESAQSASNNATTAEVKAMEALDSAQEAKEYAESIDPESLKVKTVFSINEASKDASGNPNFMSVVGNQIIFNGAVKYTQANGVSKGYASVSPIALRTIKVPYEVPLQTSNTSPDLLEFGSVYSSQYEAWRAFDGNVGTSFIGADGSTSNYLKRTPTTKFFCKGIKIESTLYGNTGPTKTVNWYRDSSKTELIGTTMFDGVIPNEKREIVLDDWFYVDELYLDFPDRYGNYTPSIISIEFIEPSVETYATSDYVMLNNGVASVVPALEVQQSNPYSAWEQPVLTSNTSSTELQIPNTNTNTDKDNNWKMFDGNDGTYMLLNASGTEYTTVNFSLGSDLQIKQVIVAGTVVPHQASGLSRAELVIDGVVISTNEDINGVVTLSGNDTITNLFSLKMIGESDAGSFRTRITNIQIEAYNPITNQTVWFNPYNNQAKQYNGTDWVDYNGVPVGTIIDGVAYTYQYNTQKNVEPWINTATKDSLNELNRFRLIDSYRQDVFWYKIFEETQNDGSVKYWCRQGGLTYVESNKNITQTLLIPFTEREPTLLGQSTESRIDSQSINMYFNPYWLSIQIYNGATNQSIYWYAEGYCAKPEEIL